uniref:Uncharacterized protein n=1 Tax=Knipowitschia caucasica TaxID=637954 RepID=A0AAV2M5Q5_KNICA
MQRASSFSVPGKCSVGGRRKGTLQQLVQIIGGLGGVQWWGGGGEAWRLLAPGTGQQVREDDDYQNTSRQPWPGGERGCSCVPASELPSVPRQDGQES